VLTEGYTLYCRTVKWNWTVRFRFSRRSPYKILSVRSGPCAERSKETSLLHIRPLTLVPIYQTALRHILGNIHLEVYIYIYIYICNFPCGRGIEYLHLCLENRKRQRKENPVPGVYLGHPVPVGYKYGGPGPPGWGSLKNWDNKIWSWVPQDWDPRETELARPAAKVNYRPVLSSERDLQYNKPPNCPKKISRWKKNWLRVPDDCMSPRRTGRLTVGRNIILTLTI
jgi:hypothetical protein